MPWDMPQHDTPSWFERRALARAKKREGYTGERTEDVYLPNKAEMAQQESRKNAREAIKKVLSGKYRDDIDAITNRMRQR